MGADTALTGSSVGFPCIDAIGDDHAKDIDVQGMIHQVKLSIGVSIRRAIDPALLKLRIGGREWGFEVVGELV